MTKARPPIARSTEPPWDYAIALGSNRSLRRRLDPPAILRAALAALDAAPFTLLRASPILTSRPIGPSRRSYANAVALIACPLPPHEVLARLQAIEHGFGRRRAQRWGARTLDLDIILWRGGMVRAHHLRIPHPAYRMRAFVIAPLAATAPRLRDPRDGATMRAIARRLVAPKPVDRPAPRH